MPDHPIIFSGPMVRALLDGRKSQTRRVMPDRPLISTFNGRPVAQGKDGIYRSPPTRYAVGDRLWVREAWQHARQRYCRCPQGSEPAPCDAWSSGTGCASNRGDVIYRADAESVIRWRSSIHMPRWASRLTLLVTDVRVQRLQEISEEDATAEGVYRGKASGRYADSYATMAVAGIWFPSARAWYADYWNRLHGAGSWEANPWIIALTFSVVHANIDHLVDANKMVPAEETA